MIFAVFNRRFPIERLSLAAGKRIEAAEKRQLRAAFYPKNFRIISIGIVTEKNYGGGIPGGRVRRGLHLSLGNDSETRGGKPAFLTMSYVRSSDSSLVSGFQGQCNRTILNSSQVGKVSLLPLSF